MTDLFEYYITDEKFHFKYAKGKPTVEGREFHNYDEIVLFIDGNSQLISKNIQLELKKDSIILIPKEHFHQFNITSPESYTRCILGFQGIQELKPLIDQIMTDVAVISLPTNNILNIFNRLIYISKSELSENEKRLSVKSAIAGLLIEIKLFSGNHIDSYISISEQTRAALTYIDSHYAEDLSLKSIADFLNTSVSSLSHRFSKDLNISVYRYITEKRLSVARQHIEKGKSLTEAAYLSGFKEYSSFFRFYKNQSGASPSKQIKIK